jgi:hypothetical protein
LKASLSTQGGLRSGAIVRRREARRGGPKENPSREDAETGASSVVLTSSKDMTSRPRPVS